MTLMQLNYIITISETGSLNKASELLYVSQPSLTSAVKELEKELGITIFNRSGKGVTLTNDGAEFLLHAKEIYGQYQTVMEKYGKGGSYKKKFGVSTQHYSFAVKAFVDMVKSYDMSQYEFAIRETKTRDVINDVSTMRSEIGVLYLNQFNEAVIRKELQNHELVFTPLFTAKPHVFVSTANPLAAKDAISLEDLAPYPRLSYEQGAHNAFYFSEEILSTRESKKDIVVRDRATLFNLLIGLNGYTICSGVISQALNGANIVSVPLLVDDSMEIGYITHSRILPSPLAKQYIEALRRRTSGMA